MNPSPEQIEAGFRELWATELSQLGDDPARYKEVAERIYLAMQEPVGDVVERDMDPWNPRNEDPFWMLEAEDGEWLKNERTLTGTRDPTKAVRFPTERDAANHRARMTPGYKWWTAKPTEHTWIAALSTHPVSQGDDLERRIMREIERQAPKGGLVFTYAQVEKGIRASLAAMQPRGERQHG